jgi:hypothetical protein
MGSLKAVTEKEAIEKAAKEFNIRQRCEAG